MSESDFWKNGDPADPLSYLPIEARPGIERAASASDDPELTKRRAVLAMHYSREYKCDYRFALDNVDSFNRECFRREIGIDDAYRHYTRGNMRAGAFGTAYRENSDADLSPDVDIAPGKNRDEVEKENIARMKRPSPLILFTRSVADHALRMFSNVGYSIAEAVRTDMEKKMLSQDDSPEWKKVVADMGFDRTREEANQNQLKLNLRSMAEQRKIVAEINAGVSSPTQRRVNEFMVSSVPHILVLVGVSAIPGVGQTVPLAVGTDVAAQTDARLQAEFPGLPESERKKIAAFSGGLSMLAQLALQGVAKLSTPKPVTGKFAIWLDKTRNVAIGARQIGKEAAKVSLPAAMSDVGGKVVYETAEQKIVAGMVQVVDKSFFAILKKAGIDYSGGFAVGSLRRLIQNSIEVGAGLRPENQRFDGVFAEGNETGTQTVLFGALTWARLRNTPSIRQAESQWRSVFNNGELPADLFMNAQNVKQKAFETLRLAWSPEGETPVAPPAPVAPRNAGGTPTVKPSGTGMSPIVAAPGEAASAPAPAATGPAAPSATAPVAPVNGKTEAPTLTMIRNAEIAKARIVADAVNKYAAAREMTLPSSREIYEATKSPEERNRPETLEGRVEISAGEASDVEHLHHALPFSDKASEARFGELHELYSAAKFKLLRGWTPELAAKIMADGHTRIDQVPAFYDVDTGIAYFNVLAIRPSRVDALFTHEILSHAGVRGLLGDERAEMFYRRVFDEFRDSPAMEEVVRKYGLAPLDAYNDPMFEQMNDKARAIAGEEFFAAVGEETLKPGTERSHWYTPLLIRQKMFLQRFLPGLHFTMNDLEGTLAAAAHRLRRQRAEVARRRGKGAQGNGVRFAYNLENAVPSKEGYKVERVNENAGAEFNQASGIVCGENAIYSDADVPAEGKMGWIRQRCVDYAKENGIIGVHDTPCLGGNVAVTERGIRHDLHHFGAPIRHNMIAVIPEMLKNAVLIQTESDNRSTTHILAAKVRYGGERFVVGLVINENNGKFFYDHELTEIDALTGGTSANTDAGTIKASTINVVRKALLSSGFDANDAKNTRFSISPVYTGSAADYDAPSLHYVGTGEGAQVYGWGLYGSSEREVAEWYAEKDVQHKRHPDVIWDGKPSDKFFSHLRRDGMPEKDKNRYWRLNDLNQILLDKKGDVDRVIEICRRNIEEAESFNQKDVVEENRERIKLLEEYRDKIRFHEGTQQSLSINGEKFVPGGDIVGKADWERKMIGFLFSTNGDVSRALQNVKIAIAHIESKIREQGKEFDTDFDRNSLADLNKVKEFLSDKSNKVSYDDGTTGRRNLYEQTFWPDKRENLLDWDALVSREQLEQIHAQLKKEGLFDAFQPAIDYGEELYHNLVNTLGSPKAASEFLYRAGIDGITYIGDTSDVRNYIAFSDKDIRIDQHVRYAIEDGDNAPLVEPKPFDPASVDYEDADQRAVQVLMARYATAAEFDDEEAADYLRGAGFEDITPQQAHKLVARAREEYRSHRMAEIRHNNARRRDDWLYDNVPLYRHAVDFGGKGFKIRMPKDYAHKDDRGKLLAKPNEPGIDLIELAKYIGRVEGRPNEEKEIAEELADFYRDLKLPDLYRMYHDAVKETKEGERELDRQAKEEYSRYIEDQARDIIEAGQGVDRATLEDNHRLAAVLYNQLLGKPFTGRITNGDLDDINAALVHAGNNPRLVSRISRAIRETMQQEYTEKMRDFRDKLRSEIRDAAAMAKEAEKMLREFIPPQYRGRYIDDLVKIAGITNAAKRKVAFDALCDKITQDADISSGADLAAKAAKDKIYFELPKGERDRYLARLASIMKLPTPEKRVEAFDGLLQDVMKTADDLRKVKYLDKFAERLAQLPPKVNKSRRLVGTRTIETQAAIAEIARYAKLTSGDVDILRDALVKQLNAADAEGAPEIEAKLALLGKFGALAERSGAEVYDAYDVLQRIAIEGRNALLQQIGERKAKSRAIREFAIRRMTSGKGVPTGEARQALDTVNREKIANTPRAAGYSALNLESLLYEIASNGETGDWLENSIGRLLQNTHICSRDEKTDERNFSNELNAGIDRALGTANPVARAVKLTELRTRVEHTGVWRYSPEQRKIEFTYVSEDEARRRIAEYDRGEGTLKTYQAELVRARLRARAVKMEKTIELDDPDPSAKAVFDAMDAEYRETDKGREHLIGIPTVTFEGEMYEWGSVGGVGFNQIEARSMKNAWLQKDGRYRMEMNGWTEESIKQLDDFLLPEVNKLAEFALDFYARQGDKISPVYEAVFYTQFPQVENYSPLIMPKTTVSANTATPGLDDPAAAASAPRRLTPANLAMRTANIMEPKPHDFLTVLVEQARGVRHFVYWAEHARDLRSVFFDPDLKAACDMTFGAEFFPVLKNAILDTINGGRVTPATMADNLSRQLVTNAVSMRMLFGYVSGIKQMMSGFAYANDVPLVDFARDLAYSWTHPAETIGKLLQSDYLKNRFTGGADIFQAMAFDTRNRYVAAERIAGKIGRALKFAKTGAAIGESLEVLKSWGSLAQRLGDSFPVVIFGSAVYRYHYRRMIDEGFSPEEAEKHALLRWEMSSESLQQSAAIHNQNEFQKSTIGRLGTVFKSANILGGQRWLREAIAGLSFGRKGKYVDDGEVPNDGEKQYSGSEAAKRGHLRAAGKAVAALIFTGTLIKLVGSRESDARKHPKARKSDADALLDSALGSVADNASVIPGAQGLAEEAIDYLTAKIHGQKGSFSVVNAASRELLLEDLQHAIRSFRRTATKPSKRKDGKTNAELIFEGVAYGLRQLGVLAPNLGAPAQAALQGKRIVDYFLAPKRKIRRFGPPPKF